MSSFSPSAEQQAILSAYLHRGESMMIRAFAGCAKTSTLELIAHKSDPSVPILYLVFNVKNKKEAEKRFPSHVQVLTINGLGHRAIARALGRALTLDDRKLGRLVTAQLRAESLAKEEDLWIEVRSLVTSAMQAGLIPSAFSQRGLLPDTDDSWESLREDSRPAPQVVALARAVLVASIKECYNGLISFDDQIYFSTMFGGVFPRYPVVFVDEAQDQSRLNAIMIRRAAAGRLIIVGDEKQAIYAWRGADAAAMAHLKTLREEWIELPLATTFRCAKVVVARNARHAPGFTAFHNNKEGEFYQLPRARVRASASTTGNGQESSPDKVESGSQPNGELLASWSAADLPPSSSLAILCRNNAPLLTLAFKLLRAGIPVVMAGRDIGKGLQALSKKLGKDDQDIAAHIAVITQWQQEEVTLALANDNEGKADSASDRAGCLLAVASSDPRPKTAGELRRKLDELFSRESGKVTLSTIHRAKGLEWDTVIHLSPHLIPSRFAKKPAALEQERNLRYVCETRAKCTLIEANLDHYEREKE